MRRALAPLVGLLGALAAVAAPASGAGGVRAQDDVGRTVTLSAPAQRIVSLSPHLTELLFAAGAGDKVVGTVSHSDFPPPAREIARVGGYESLDLERIVALEPDLVVAWDSGNVAGQVERLQAAGLTVFRSEPRRLADIPVTLEKLGRLAGTEARARAAAARFRTRRAVLDRRYRDRPTVTVFYEIWDDPLITVSGDHMISSVIRLCGGRNVFADLGALAPTVSREAVLAADPEVIIASGRGASQPEWLSAWRRWSALTAVRRNNLFVLPADLIQRQTPRVLRGAERLCEKLETARRRRPPAHGR